MVGDSNEFIVKLRSVPVTRGTCSPLPRRTGSLSVCSSSAGSEGGVTKEYAWDQGREGEGRGPVERRGVEEGKGAEGEG